MIFWKHNSDLLCFRIFQWLPILLTALIIKYKFTVMVYKSWWNLTLLALWFLSYYPHPCSIHFTAVNFLADPRMGRTSFWLTSLHLLFCLPKWLGPFWYRALSAHVTSWNRSSLLPSIRNFIWRTLSEVMVFIYSHAYLLFVSPLTTKRSPWK